MNGALILALAASALVGVSTASPADADAAAAAALQAALTAPCQTDLRKSIPVVTEQCGGKGCSCADTSACQTDQTAVMCVLRAMNMLNDDGTPNDVLALEASAQTGIDISAPVSLASLTAEAKMINEKGCALSNWCDAVDANPKCALKPLVAQLYAALDASPFPGCQGWRTAAGPTVCTAQTTIMAAAGIAAAYKTDIATLIRAGNDIGADCLTVEMYQGAAQEAADAELDMMKTPPQSDGSLAADGSAAQARTCLLQLAAELDAGC